MAIFANNLTHCARAKDNILNDQGRDLQWIQTGPGVSPPLPQTQGQCTWGKALGTPVLDESQPSWPQFRLPAHLTNHNILPGHSGLVSLLLIINPCFTQRKPSKIHTFFSKKKKVMLLTYLLRGHEVEWLTYRLWNP